MSPKSKTTPANHTRSRRQLAALATLLGLMQTASKLSAELDALADQVGGSLEQIAETAGVPFFEVHQAYAGLPRARRKPRAAVKAPGAPKAPRARRKA
ncbi:hypothetical protein [Rhodopseudomonas palustris]|uniref:hypothetical protein n=1 Tax=Rhodopseudomonas palustris TaxID=1076 RepID=UPI000B215D89|nr:hypothetical protein [Rhodopseudomonas palustris]